MSPSLSRLILSIVFLVSVLFVCFVAFVIFERTIIRRDPEALVASLILTAIYLLIGWLAIWRGAVKWTSWRSALTFVSVFVCIIPALIPGGIVYAVLRQFDRMPIGVMVTVCGWALLWLASTALIWRETKAERAERLQMLGINTVACPNCGYNLTGMTSTTCPECGKQYTLDTLYANLRKTDEQIEQV